MGGNFGDDSFLLKKDTLDINHNWFTYMYSNTHVLENFVLCNHRCILQYPHTVK